MANDGSITLPVKVDTSGVKQGASNIRNAIDKTSISTRKLGIELANALREGDTKSAKLILNFKKATEAVEQQTEKVKTLQNELDVLNGKTQTGASSLGNLKREADEARNNLLKIYSQATGKGQVSYLEALTAKTSDLNEKYREQYAEALRVETAARSAYKTQIEEVKKTKEEVAELNIKLDSEKQKLEELTVKAEISGQKMNDNMGDYRKETSLADKALSKLGKRIGRLAVSALVFSAITKAFTSFRQTVGNALMSNEEFRNSIYALEASLWVVAQPIYEAVLPGLKTLIRWLTIGILYVATFFSALGGKTLKQTMESAKALNKQSLAFESTSKSASKSTKTLGKTSDAIKKLKNETKSANKELATFDDLVILGKKGIDTISPGGVDFSGIEDAFKNLENIISEEDMEKLQEFGDWVMENSDSIKLALEVAGWGAFTLAVGGAIKSIGDLLGWFKKKDEGLDTQTKKTQGERDAVDELAKSWSLAPASAYGFIPAIDELTDSGLEFIPAFSDARSGVKEFYPQLDYAKESAFLLSPALGDVITQAWGFSPAFNDAKTSVENFNKASIPALSKVGETTQGLMGKFGQFVVVSARALSNTGENITNFASDSAKNMGLWGVNIAENVSNAMFSAAESVYKQLSNAGENFSKFLGSFVGVLSNMDEIAGETLNNIASNFIKLLRFFDASSKKAEKGEPIPSESSSGISWGKVLKTVGGVALTAAALATPIPGDEVAASTLFLNSAKKLIFGYANGTVVPPNKPHLAWLGDNTKEPEVVSPVSTMKQAVKEAMIEIGGSGNTEVILEIDGREFGRAVVEQGNRENRRIGTRLVLA